MCETNTNIFNFLDYNPALPAIFYILGPWEPGKALSALSNKMCLNHNVVMLASSVTLWTRLSQLAGNYGLQLKKFQNLLTGVKNIASALKVLYTLALCWQRFF